MRRRLRRVARARWVLHPATPAVLRWSERSLRRLRIELKTAGLHAGVAAPPDGPGPIVNALALWLRLRRTTCLERSLILQRWLAAHDQPHDVLVGVSASDGFTAHAWLDHEDGAGHAVLTRIPSPR